MDRLTYYDGDGRPCYRAELTGDIGIAGGYAIIVDSEVARKLAAYEDAEEEAMAHHPVEKKCGYYGCNVSAYAECECTQCDICTGGCQDCMKFPERVRRDIFLHDAMQEKCKACKEGAG